MFLLVWCLDESSDGVLYAISYPVGGDVGDVVGPPSFGMLMFGV